MGESRKVGSGQVSWDHMGLVDYGDALGRRHMGLMSFQAAAQLGPTQIVKIMSQTTPMLILDPRSGSERPASPWPGASTSCGQTGMVRHSRTDGRDGEACAARSLNPAGDQLSLEVDGALDGP